jgi:osmotically-inducible protein OsmY
MLTLNRKFGVRCREIPGYRSDAEIRGIALQILHWDTEVPDEFVEVKVQDSWLTLSGTVTYQLESDGAYDDVAALQGVLGITNEIKVVTP